jgi:hypothetical protein
LNKPIEFTIRGTVDWCKLFGPARKYDGDPRFDKGPYWSVEINPDAASREKLAKYGLDELVPNGKMRKDKPKKKDGTERKNVRPYDYLRLTILEERADGQKNQPPQVQDSYRRPWNPSVEIGNQSVVDILVRFVDYGTTQGLYFKKMRVLKLVEFERTGSDFEPLSEDDEYFGALEDMSDNVPFPLPEGMEPAHNEEELDDDLP